MRILINQATALGAKTGIGHYTLQLLRALREVAPHDRFEVFPPDWWTAMRRLGKALRPSSGAQANVAGRSWKSAVSSRLRSFGDDALAAYLRVITRWHGFDLYHEPNIVPLASELPTVATIQDLSVLVHPEWHPADRVAFYERSFATGLKQCRRLIAISEFTRREVLRVLNVPPERITCTPLGVRDDIGPVSGDELTATIRRLGLPSQYLLFVGTIEPRKNPNMLMRAYCDLPFAVRERCPLVLAGSWGWNAAEFREFYEREARHAHVLHLGYVADEDLSALYAGARALVFPSFYEGFGLPILEMMAVGGAVLASTADALVEISGGKAHCVPADDRAGWREAMLRIILDDGWRDSLRSGVIEHAQSFSWTRCARQTLDVYRDVLNTGRRAAA
jgi:glycosyltransferase involved in cell wall biosynthesis